MDETLLLGRSMAGDLDSFGQLYDRYFTRVYDFAWRVLRDEVAASDATADVFAAAARDIRAAGKAESFAPWLFTLAHRIVVERSERGAAAPDASFEEAFGTFDVPDPAALEDPGVAAGDHELAALVWEAVSILSPRDYALLDLHLRQGLEAQQLAPILGANPREAKSIVERMRAMANNVLADYVIARRSSCGALDKVLVDAEFPPYSESVRRAIDEHVASHPDCAAQRSALPPLLPIFASFAAIAAPFAIKGDIWADIATAWRAPHPGEGEPYEEEAETLESPYAAAAAGGVAAGALAGSGFRDGGYGDRRVLLGGDDSADWGRNRILLFAAAALGLLLFAFAGAAVFATLGGGDGDDDDGSAAVGTASPGIDLTPGADGSETPGVSIDTATPDLTASAEPSATETETPAPDTPTPPPPATNTPIPIPPTATQPPAPTPPPPGASPTRTPFIRLTPNAGD